MAYVIVAVLLAAVIGAPFLVSWLRKRAEQERERRMNIARGVFDKKSLPAKRKNKFSAFRRAFEKGRKPRLDYEVEKQLRARLPWEVNALLKAQIAARESHKVWTAARNAAHEAKYGNEKLFGYWSVPTAKDMDAWRMHATYLASHKAARELFVARQIASNDYSAATEARSVLSKTLKELEPWDVTACSDEVVLAFEMAKHAVAHVAPDGLDYSSPDFVAGEPSQVVEEFERQAADVMPLLADALAAAVATDILKERTVSELTALHNIEEGSDVVDPAKPTDADVQTFAQHLLEWRQTAKTQRGVLNATLPALEQAIAALNSELSKITDHLDLLKQSQEQAAEARRQANAQRLVGWDKDAKEPARKRDRRSQILDSKARALLSDEGVAFLAVAQRIKAIGAIAAGDATDKLQQGKLRCIESGLPLQMTAELQAAVRKLGFAAAQHGIALARLAEFNERPLKPVEERPPSVVDGNVDGYIAAYGNWLQQCATNESARTTRSQQLANLQTQESERRQQLQAAAKAMESFFSLKVDGIVHHDLARIAELLEARHSGRLEREAAGRRRREAEEARKKEEAKKKKKKR